MKFRFSRLQMAAVSAAFAAAVAVGGCAGDSKDAVTAPPSTSLVPSTQPDSAKQSAPSNNAPSAVPSVSGAPSDIEGGDPNSVISDTAPDGPADVDVRIGVDDSPQRVAKVRAGQSLHLNLTNPTDTDTFQVTGLDISRTVAAGVTATINIDVTTEGTFPVTSAVTGGVVLIVEVV